MTSKDERSDDKQVHKLNADSPGGELEFHYGWRRLFPKPLDPTDTDGSKTHAKGIFDPYWVVTASEPFDVDEFIATIRQGRRVMWKSE